MEKRIQKFAFAAAGLILNTIALPAAASNPRPGVPKVYGCVGAFDQLGSLSSQEAPANVPSRKPDPKSLSLPKALVIGGKRVEVHHPSDLDNWWNAGPYPQDLPAMNAAHLAKRIRSLGAFGDDLELASQIQEWEPFARQWQEAYLYQVATNPPPRGITEWQAKGYQMVGSGNSTTFVREGKPVKPPRGNFTAPARADLMQAILDKAADFRRAHLAQN